MPTDASVKSTPQARGTAAYSEFNRDFRAGNPKNIRRVQKDLEKSTQKVHIIPLLQAFVAQTVLESKGCDLRPDLGELREIHKEGQRIFLQMFNDAISFCNDDGNVNRAQLFENLEDYANQAYEIDRYRPMSVALNTILYEFKDTNYGTLPGPSTRGGGEELILMRNDQVPIQSTFLEYDCPKAQRKPDIVGIFLSYIKEIFSELKTMDFSEVADVLSEESIEGNRARPPKWIDIHQTWELKVKNRKMKLPERKWTLKNILQDLRKQPARNNRKRPADESTHIDEPPATISRGLFGNFPSRIHTSILPDETSSSENAGSNSDSDTLPTVDPDTQCGYYGIERLSAEWHITHSIVILLEDAALSVRWFDAQGCIQSEPFDIFEQLPVLVLMTIIFQRFTPRTWGLTERNPMKVKVENKNFHLDKTPTPFQLHGRRTTGTHARYDHDIPHEAAECLDICTQASEHIKTQPEPPVDEAEDDIRLFFKSTWTEISRYKEFQIIKEAHTRVNALLPEKYRTMVTNHIPSVVAAEECNTSTTTIRMFLKYSGALSHLTVDNIQKRGRVRIWMVTRLLEAAHDLEPHKFLRVLWDTIRCHYLLWKCGIAHGDISLTNLMHRLSIDNEVIGILNDFDLATIMLPGERCPEEQGWERTGTLPFMALDLLEYLNGESRRWYRHDLESFLWVLIWEMQKKPNISWTAGRFDKILTSKGQVISNIGDQVDKIKIQWKTTFQFLWKWCDSWSDHKRLLTTQIADSGLREDRVRSTSEIMAIRDEADCGVADSDHVRAAVACAKEEGIDFAIPALSDTDWIDVKLETTALSRYTNNI